MSSPPLIAHVLHHFGVGGMENGVVNLINHLPPNRYRHVIICLTAYNDFHQRLNRPVELIALHKKAGHDFGLYARLFRVLRQLKPALIHTRNLSALEAQAVAAAAGVRARVHGEHGRDIYDLYGRRLKYNLLRRGLRPLIHRYIAVSRDLAHWLKDTVHVAPQRVVQIYNGVDSEKFAPRKTRTPLGPPGFSDADSFIIGSVGRMAEVKDYPALVRAFLRLLEIAPELRQRARLVILGEGVTRAHCLELLQQAGAADLAWLPGECENIAELMPQFDLFALPSLGEGISNTILEAMACALPVIATQVGGNGELVEAGRTGELVPAADPEQMAQALLKYMRNEALTRSHSQAGRAKIEAHFSMAAMVSAYSQVYDAVLAAA